nr:DUF262 domain-containing protein [Stenotrophomonas geniculata]
MSTIPKKTFIVSQHEPVSLWGWLQELRADRLDLSPTFQRRGRLWSRFKRAHLIDSVINGFDIPKLYVADFTLAPSALNEKKKPYAVVDGRQRLEAFFEFFNDGLPLNKSAVFEQQPSLKIGGLTYSQLKEIAPHLAEKIEDFEPVVMSIVTDDDAKIAEMFVRLNSGEAANSAERRNAQPGPVPDLVRELTAHPFLSNRIKFSTARMAEFNLAAKLLMIEHRKGFVDTKAANLDRFVLNVAEESGAMKVGDLTSDQEGAIAALDGSMARCVNVLEDMATIFEPRDRLLNAAGHIPVYYWVIRNYPEASDNFRDFLEEFTNAVDESREASRSGIGRVDDELLVYYTFGRTTNDQNSLKGRYRILTDRMKRKKLI